MDWLALGVVVVVVAVAVAVAVVVVVVWWWSWCTCHRQCTWLSFSDDARRGIGVSMHPSGALGTHALRARRAPFARPSGGSRGNLWAPG